MNGKRFVSLLIFVLAVGSMLGCGLFSSAAETAQPDAQAPNVTNPAPVDATEQPAAPAVRGPGSFDLADPAAGLDQLAGYRAHLTTKFSGSLAGQPYEVTTTIDRSLVVAVEDFVAAMDYTATDTKPFYLLSGKVGDQVVKKPSRDANCQTIVDPTLADLGEIPDPIGELWPVFGAEQVGEEAIGEISAVHYRFDGQALKLSKGSASGEVWVAKEGGWVVKYTLQVQAPVGVFGPDMEGTQTWDYEASPLKEISMPEGCFPALDGFPLLSDALDLVRMNGALRYTSASGRDEAVQFYQDQMKSAGWAEQQAFSETAEQAVLVFIKAGEKDQQVVSIALRSTPGRLSIDIQVITTPLPPAPAAPTP